MTIAINGTISVTVSIPVQTVGFTETGLPFTVPSPTQGTSIVRVTEGFADSFRAKNLSFTVGNGGPGNATFGGTGYAYNGNTHRALLGQPEVEQLHLPGARHHDVLGLQIAVHDSECVRRCHTFRHLNGYLDRLSRRHRAAIEHLTQRFAFHQLRDKVGLFAVLADIVNGDNIRMVEQCERACLLLKPRLRAGSPDTSCGRILTATMRCSR